MKIFEFDKAESIFIDLLGGKRINVDNYGFSREFEFHVEGVKHRVIWYKNQSTLIVGNIRVMFFDCEISNTWPSPTGAKKKIQFRDSRGDCVAVIVLEWFKNENA